MSTKIDEDYNVLGILNTVQWYACTNLGTGPGDPHTCHIKDNSRTASGQSTNSIEEAIINAYKALSNNGEI